MSIAERLPASLQAGARPGVIERMTQREFHRTTKLREAPGRDSAGARRGNVVGSSLFSSYVLA